MASMKSLSHLLLAVSMVPLSSQDWVELKYKNIPSNQVKFENSQVQIQVNQSASPLIHRLQAPQSVNGFSFKLNIKGGLTNAQADQFLEDSYFRLGLVASGEKTLNWWQKKVAADWVLKLFSMAPQGVGLDKIYFFNVSPYSDQVGKARVHPKSELMHEFVVASHSENKEVLEVNHQLKMPLQVVALWLSSDGDDTKSQFEVQIQKIELKKTE